MPEHDCHLMRTAYRTDVDPAEPQYMGLFSTTIPASAFRDGTTIVAVDWLSEPGTVWVTYLMPGRAPGG